MLVYCHEKINFFMMLLMLSFSRFSNGSAFKDLNFKTKTFMNYDEL